MDTAEQSDDDGVDFTLQRDFHADADCRIPSQISSFFFTCQINRSGRSKVASNLCAGNVRNEASMPNNSLISSC